MRRKLSDKSFHKICTKCGEEKHKDLFGFAPGGIYQRRGKCIACCKEQKREYSAKHSKEAVERVRQWRKDNPEHAAKLNRECNKIWREKNPEKMKIINKAKAERLTDSYLRGIISRNASPDLVITEEMLALKRATMLLKRARPEVELELPVSSDPNVTSWFKETKPTFRGWYERISGSEIELDWWQDTTQKWMRYNKSNRLYPYGPELQNLPWRGLKEPFKECTRCSDILPLSEFKHMPCRENGKRLNAAYVPVCKTCGKYWLKHDN